MLCAPNIRPFAFFSCSQQTNNNQVECPVTFDNGTTERPRPNLTTRIESMPQPVRATAAKAKVSRVRKMWQQRSTACEQVRQQVWPPSKRQFESLPLHLQGTSTKTPVEGASGVCCFAGLMRDICFAICATSSAYCAPALLPKPHLPEGFMLVWSAACHDTIIITNICSAPNQL